MSFILEKVLFDNEHEHPGGVGHGHGDEHVITIESYEDHSDEDHTEMTALGKASEGEQGEKEVSTDEDNAASVDTEKASLMTGEHEEQHEEPHVHKRKTERKRRGSCTQR